MRWYIRDLTQECILRMDVRSPLFSYRLSLTVLGSPLTHPGAILKYALVTNCLGRDAGRGVLASSASGEREKRGRGISEKKGRKEKFDFTRHWWHRRKAHRHDDTTRHDTMARRKTETLAHRWGSETPPCQRSNPPNSISIKFDVGRSGNFLRRHLTLPLWTPPQLSPMASHY
jgi:hypothetical protein